MDEDDVEREERVRGRKIVRRVGNIGQTSRSAPPHRTQLLYRIFPVNLDALIRSAGQSSLAQFMLSAHPVDFTFTDEEWKSPPLYRAASVGSWGVTSIGRGFDWDEEDRIDPPSTRHNLPLRNQQEIDAKSGTEDSSAWQTKASISPRQPAIMRPVSNVSLTPPTILTAMPPNFTPDPLYISPTQSPSASPRPQSQTGSNVSSSRFPFSRSPSSPRPRRRSSQQRVSLIAGRVSIAPIEPPSPPPSPPPILPPSLHRAGSASSLLSVAVSTAPPSPKPERESFLGGRSISEFVIEGDIGRGAYGLVKRGREIQADGSLGPPLVIKQVIKSRILADCWKKHPKHGTIPIEIYVMSAISNTSYILPPRRPWSPSRLLHAHNSLDLNIASDDPEWIGGTVVKGHPNICPLLDFFEDNHYYYLVLPSTTPERQASEPSPPSDLFDLVESYPRGLPPASIRSYLGQIADAICFLHSQGIVHRDIKDENVVLGPEGKCILIDFGSSGLVKKGGWDTFSGTLDYAGPEILRGERYYGKEQDVWAFGVVAYVLLVGECPFMTAAEAQDGLESPFANASIALDERCGEGKEQDGEEIDGGGALGDAAVLVRACLQVEVKARPTFEKILQSRFLSGNGGWGTDGP